MLATLALTTAFAVKPVQVHHAQPMKQRTCTPFAAALSRRELGAATFAAAAAFQLPKAALAAGPTKVVVAGATGQTGRRVLDLLASKGGLTVIGGVRNPEAAKTKLAEASTTVRGAMAPDIVPAVDISAVKLAKLDVVKDSVDAMAETLKGADSLVIATGFVPGNPFNMGKDAHLVDNVGTIALVDAAKKAGVSKVVLVSSILTDAGAWNQRGSPGFQVTNAFGGVLDEKLVAEKYLRASGLDYSTLLFAGAKPIRPSSARRPAQSSPPFSTLPPHFALALTEQTRPRSPPLLLPSLPIPPHPSPSLPFPPHPSIPPIDHAPAMDL